MIVAKKGVPRGKGKQNKHHSCKPPGHRKNRKKY